MRIPKASEFFILGIDDLELKTPELKLINENSLGGIILFKRNISSLEQVIALNSAILKANPTAPIISVDQEGGRVARLRGICTDIPPLAELEKIFLEDPTRAFKLGAMQAKELKSLGFSLNFSPVCDVFSHKDNEVIGDRAFSTKAEVVASLAAQFINGMQSFGIAACAKHFPGHGATAVDSHFALPVLNASLEDLKKRELIPFSSAINADVATIMTAHIINESLDTVPATMSKKTLDDLLRKSLGFKNVLISDDLEMKAVADNYELANIIENGFRASVDMFIMGHDLAKNQQAIAILQNLIDTDEEIRKNSIASAQRIENLRTKYAPKPDLNAAQKVVRNEEHLSLFL